MRSGSDMNNRGLHSDVRKQLAQAIRWLRFERGWSQEVLAELTGLHRSYISTIEREKCNISLSSLEKLAGAFGLSVVGLLSYADHSRRYHLK